MAYIKLPTDQETGNKTIDSIFEEIKKLRGNVPAPYRAFSLQSHILQANWNKTKNVSKQGNLPFQIKESIALAVSVANDCTFCIHIHSNKLKEMGLAEEEIEDIKKAGFKDEKTDLVLKFVVQATRDPHKLSQKDFDNLRNVGYSDADILEILTVMEMFTGYNKIVSALNIQLDD